MNDNNLRSSDRLLLFGYGLFETLRVTSNGIEVPYLHWQRMRAGGDVLNLKVPEYSQWLQAINHYLDFEYTPTETDHGRAKPFGLRLTLSGGDLADPEGSPQLLFHPRPLPYRSEQYEHGVTLVILPRPRNEHSILTTIKSTNYLENILARELAQKQGAFDGIWLNTQGYLAEATASNLFFIKDNTLYTPSIRCGCLPGTRRKLILEIASSLGIAVKEGEYRVEDLMSADEVFLTNALMGIMPVSRIDEQDFTCIRTKFLKSVTLQLIGAYQTKVLTYYRSLPGKN